MIPPAGRGCLRDEIHHVHPVDHLAEDGVAGPPDAEVEAVVVADVDEELGGGTVGRVRPGHRDGPSGVPKAVSGLVPDRVSRGFLFHLRGETASLDHEVQHDPVEDRPVVVVRAQVLEEVGDGQGRHVRLEHDRDGPEALTRLRHVECHHRSRGHGGRRGLRGFRGRRRGGRGLRECEDEGEHGHLVVSCGKGASVLPGGRF